MTCPSREPSSATPYVMCRVCQAAWELAFIFMAGPSSSAASAGVGNGSLFWATAVLDCALCLEYFGADQVESAPEIEWARSRVGISHGVPHRVMTALRLRKGAERRAQLDMARAHERVLHAVLGQDPQQSWHEMDHHFTLNQKIVKRIELHAAASRAQQMRSERAASDLVDARPNGRPQPDSATEF